MFALILVTLGLLIDNINSLTCCRILTDSDSCTAETGTGAPCVWLDPAMTSQQPIIEAADGDQCVSADWAVCKAIDVTDDCVSTTDGVPPPWKDTYPDDCGSTASPTLAPTYEPCTSTYDYNLQFIIDESGSVTWYDDYGYINTINFVTRLISSSVPESATLSALAFSMHTDFLWPFSWADDSERSGILSVLESEKDNYAQSTTDTYNALIDGITNFEESPNVLATDNNLMLLITDGQPYCANGADTGCVENVCDQTALLNRLTAYNVRVIMVGISSGFSSDSLDCLCAPEDIFEFPDFTTATLRAIEAEMRPIMCPSNPARMRTSSGVHRTSNKKTNNDHQSIMARKIAQATEEVTPSAYDSFVNSSQYMYGIIGVLLLFAACIYYKRCRNVEYKRLPDDDKVSYGSTIQA